MSVPVSQLPTQCTVASGAACTASSDVTSGVCRTIKFTTSAGTIQVQVCDKGDRYELYRQAAPGNLTFKACTGNGCVDQMAGFVSFTGTALPGGSSAPPPPSPSGATPLVDPSSPGFANETRAKNLERLKKAWASSTKVIQTFPCQYGTCAWVPWYTSSSNCDVPDLRRGDDCPIGTVDATHNCAVTDEFSLVVGLIALTNDPADQALMDALVNTLKSIRSPLYGSLPVWRASRSGNTISTAVTGNGDSAADADARLMKDLYVAATNPSFDAAARARYEQLADEMAGDFLRHDFVKTCRPGRNGVQICYWLASGGDTGHGDLTWNHFSYAGYYGDAVIALLAAYRNTGDSQYLDAARDTVNAYLLAAQFNGQSFSVPPMAFKWDTSVTPPQRVCTRNCPAGGWDESDAPRAVTICKARYYASLVGVSLPADLETYCNAWLNSPGVQSDAYSTQYTFGGTPMNNTTGGVWENGLALALNFAARTQDLSARLTEGGTHYSVEKGTWDWTPCLGVYRNAPYALNLATAIGRDLAAFTGASGSPPPPPPPAGGVAGLDVRCNAWPAGPACTKQSDATSGSCRTLVFTNPGTSSRILICAKTSGYEMYLQTPETNGQTTVCVGAHCVGPQGGFARW